MGNWVIRQILVGAVLSTVCCTVFAQRAGRTILQEWYPSKPADSAMSSWTLREGTTITVPRVGKSPRGIRLLAPYGAADAIRMTLQGLPRHSLVRVELGWHIIGPWQGSAANDRFMVMADGCHVPNSHYAGTHRNLAHHRYCGAFGLLITESCEKLWGIDHIVVSVLNAVTYTEGDVCEIAEFVQDDDFPGLNSTSALARDLHVTYLTSECHSCGDVCLMYHYRLYTDGWMSVWANRAPEAISMLLAACAQEPLIAAYHDSFVEAEHPDLTHCELVMIVNRQCRENRSVCWRATNAAPHDGLRNGHSREKGLDAYP